MIKKVSVYCMYIVFCHIKNVAYLFSKAVTHSLFHNGREEFGPRLSLVLPSWTSFEN